MRRDQYRRPENIAAKSLSLPQFKCRATPTQLERQKRRDKKHRVSNMKRLVANGEDKLINTISLSSPFAIFLELC